MRKRTTVVRGVPKLERHIRVGAKEVPVFVVRPTPGKRLKITTVTTTTIEVLDKKPIRTIESKRK